MPAPTSSPSARRCGARPIPPPRCKHSSRCSAGNLPDHRLHGPSVLDRVAVDVVVEIATDAAARFCLVDGPIGPIEQHLVGIAAMVAAAGAVEANIGGSAARPAR